MFKASSGHGRVISRERTHVIFVKTEIDNVTNGP